MLLIRLIDLYSLIVVAAVIASWIDVPRDHPIAKFLHQMTEPVLGPIRKVIPPINGIDLSPVVLLIGLRVLTSLF